MRTSAKLWVAQLKKVSSARHTGDTREDGKRLKAYLESYLDETPGSWRKSPSSTGESHPVIPENDGISGKARTKGDMKVYGFFRRLLFDATGRPVDSLTNLEKAATIEKIWKAKLKAKNLGKIAHKIVISIAPEICKEMAEMKLSVDEEIQRVVSTSILCYQEKFYSGHQLGFLIGIRHGQSDVEAHILLYPQTDKGKPVNLSDCSTVKLADGTIVQVDYQGFIQNVVETLGIEMYTDRVKGPKQSIPPPAEYGIQDKLLTEIAFRQCEQEMTLNKPDAPIDLQVLLAQVLVRKRQLLKLPDLTVRPFLEEEYERRTKAWTTMSREDAEKTIEQNIARKTKIKRAIGDLYREKSPNHDRTQRLYNQRKSISKDAYKAETMLIGWRKLKWGSRLFIDTSDGRWWVTRMRKNDELGKLMTQAHEDLLYKFKEIDRHSWFRGIKRDIAQLKRAAIQRHLAELQKLRQMRMEEAIQQIGQIRKEKEEKSERLASCRLQLQHIAISMIDARATVMGRLPGYHQQYIYWQKSGRILPITLDRIERPDLSIASNEVLATRKRAVKQSAPATPEDYQDMRTLKPPQLSDQASSDPALDKGAYADEVADEAIVSHVLPMATLSPVYTPWDIITQCLLNKESVGRALAKHRDAISQMLKIPQNDCIDHAVITPWLSPDSRESFDSVEI